MTLLVLKALGPAEVAPTRVGKKQPEGRAKKRVDMLANSEVKELILEKEERYGVQR